jgi:hypothetical protein
MAANNRCVINIIIDSWHLAANGDASSEIASLRAQLAEKDATIAKLKAEIERLSLAGAGTGEQ